jgi:anti-sigma-K factor RskA
VEDIKAYIESGILELYVLGDLGLDERLQVQAMIAKHPAIKAELGEIEHAMESYAAENAIEPTEHLREKILNSVVTNFSDDSTFTTQTITTKNNVIALPAAKANSFYKYAFAASVALLLASVVGLINLYHQLQDANTQLVALNTSNQRFTKTVNYYGHELSVYRDPSFKVIKLGGTAKHTAASMLVAFSPIKKEVMIDMADLNLPENDQAHQYQLWALVNGKPVDLGVFDKNTTDSVDMKEMKPVALAQSFAVTLEPKGGSVNPTMDQMMVIGNF